MKHIFENLGAKMLFFCAALLSVYYLVGTDWRDPSIYLVVIGLFVAVFFGDALSKFFKPKD